MPASSKHEMWSSVPQILDTGNAATNNDETIAGRSERGRPSATSYARTSKRGGCASMAYRRCSQGNSPSFTSSSVLPWTRSLSRYDHPKPETQNPHLKPSSLSSSRLTSHESCLAFSTIGIAPHSIRSHLLPTGRLRTCMFDTRTTLRILRALFQRE